MSHSGARPSLLRQIGPGIAIAATGVGAGDLISAITSGASFGTVLAWAIAVGALLKFVLNEGVARWHLGTGTSVMQGWAKHLGKPFLAFFVCYLLVWSFVVSGGLIVGSGIGAHAVFPQLTQIEWGIIHSLTAAALVWLGSYDGFERLMKVLICLMFVAICGCAAVTAFRSDHRILAIPAMPEGSMVSTLALAGGVGGSVTIMAYGYWLEQKSWDRSSAMRIVRIDLGLAYAVTGLLALAAMVLASEVLLPTGTKLESKGAEGIVEMGGMLSSVLGTPGRWIFLVGFWGAAFSSLIGVFQGVPYLFADLVANWKSAGVTRLNNETASRMLSYRAYLAVLAFPPMLFLLYDKPVWLMVVYAAVSSAFLPIMAATLLFMNNREAWVGPEYRNGWLTNVLLVAAMALFVVVGLTGLRSNLQKYLQTQETKPVQVAPLDRTAKQP